MASPSKMVVDRKKSADAVAAAASTHKARVLEAVKETLGHEASQAAGKLLDASAKVLEEKTKALLAADEKHNAELSDDPDLRAARDEHARVLRDKLVEDREVLTGIAGPSYVRQLGFEGTTSDQPDAVLALARAVEKRLGEVEVPRSRLPGYELDPAKWAKGYKEPIAKLAEALEKVRVEQREAEATLVDKQRAMAEFDLTFSRTASLVSLLLEMGGEKELARRVRPSSRKAGVTAEVAEDVDTPVVTPDEVVPG